MKRPFLFLVLFLWIGFASARQVNPAYQAQRLKINQLLDNRVARYGQFQESLSKRTGIFGLKTKKDMQRSIDLLSEIVETDNTILRETKVLLDYKDLEKAEVQTQASDSKQRIASYMAAVARLQKQSAALRADLDTREKSLSTSNNLVWGLAILVFLLLLQLLVIRYRNLKSRRTGA